MIGPDTPRGDWTGITREQVLQLAPRARQQYVRCFDEPHVLDEFGIITPLRIAHFMAQVLHESGAFSILTESLNYSSPERLMAVWPTRFRTREAALPFVHNAAALAEKVYGGRMGNVRLGDAARFIGRGPLQITGRATYARIGERLRLDLVGQPDLAITPPHMIRIAGCEWEESRCNEAADDDDILRVSGRINVGKDVSDPRLIVGYEERVSWLARTKAVCMKT